MLNRRDFEPGSAETIVSYCLRLGWGTSSAEPLVPVGKMNNYYSTYLYTSYLPWGKGEYWLLFISSLGEDEQWLYTTLIKIIRKTNKWNHLQKLISWQSVGLLGEGCQSDCEMNAKWMVNAKTSRYIWKSFQIDVFIKLPLIPATSTRRRTMSPLQNIEWAKE